MKAKPRLKWANDCGRQTAVLRIMDTSIAYMAVDQSLMPVDGRDGYTWVVSLRNDHKNGFRRTQAAAQLAAEACLRKTLKAAVRRMG